MKYWRTPALTIVMSMLFSALLSGCESKKAADPYFFLNPKLPLTAPIKLHQAGAKASLDFWVVPELNSERVRIFFIGFRVVLPASGQPNADVESKKTDFLSTGKTKMPVRVKLIKMVGAVETKIPLLEQHFAAGMENPIDQPIVNDIATRAFRTNADNELMTAKNLENPEKRYFEYKYAMVDTLEAGHYRVELEVLTDNADAANISTEILISNFRKGK